jgi:hypothetical protein
MIFKILFLAISLQSFSSPPCCKFDKDCFTIFIRSLYSRNVLSQANKNHVVKFGDPSFKSTFVRKIKVDNKTLRLKLTKSNDLIGVLNIISIKQLSPQKITIDFSLKEGGSLIEGTVSLGFSDSKPIFLDARFVTANE